MLITDILSWWYTLGWRDFVGLLFEKMQSAISFFSIGSLIRTLFAPFRQISANETGDSIDARFHAFIDRLISRIIGAIVRLGLMFIGLIVFILEFALSLVLIVVWPLLPLAPAICLFLTMTGVSL